MFKYRIILYSDGLVTLFPWEKSYEDKVDALKRMYKDMKTFKAEQTFLFQIIDTDIDKVIVRGFCISARPYVKYLLSDGSLTDKQPMQSLLEAINKKGG